LQVAIVSVLCVNGFQGCCGEEALLDHGHLIFGLLYDDQPGKSNARNFNTEYTESTAKCMGEKWRRSTLWIEMK
jgi:hypothetical protein